MRVDLGSAPCRCTDLARLRDRAKEQQAVGDAREHVAQRLVERANADEFADKAAAMGSL